MGKQVTEEEVRLCERLVDEFDKVISTITDLSNVTLQPELFRLSTIMNMFLRYIDVSLMGILAAIALIQALEEAAGPGSEPDLGDLGVRVIRVILAAFGVTIVVALFLWFRGREYEEKLTKRLEDLRSAMKSLEDVRHGYIKLLESYSSQMSSCYERLCGEGFQADPVLCAKLGSLLSLKSSKAIKTRSAYP